MVVPAGQELAEVAVLEPEEDVAEDFCLMKIAAVSEAALKM